MKTKLFKTLLAILTLGSSFSILVARPAQGGTWTYNWDSFQDGSGTLNQNGGTGGHGVGVKSNYEMMGTAIYEDLANDTVTFAFNSNLNLNGWAHSGAADGNIGWGDLFINLDKTKTFTQVQGTDSLLAVRFAGTNDSGASQVGIYQGVTAKNVTGVNFGFSGYNQYNNYVGLNNVELIDGMTTTAAQNYLGAHGYGVIKENTGSKIGDIVMQSGTQLAGLGLNFQGKAQAAGLGNTIGTQTFGFTINRAFLGEYGDFIAHVMAECSNDVMGFTIDLKDHKPVVPEPSLLWGIGLVGLALVGGRQKKSG